MRLQIIDLKLLGYKIFQQLSFVLWHVHVGVLQIPDTKYTNELLDRRVWTYETDYTV